MFIRCKPLQTIAAVASTFLLSSQIALAENSFSHYPTTSSSLTATPTTTQSPTLTTTPEPTPSNTPEQCPSPAAMDYLEAETNVVKENEKGASKPTSTTSDWVTGSTKGSAFLNQAQQAGIIEPITTAAEILRAINTTETETASKLTSCGLLELVQQVSYLDLDSTAGVTTLLTLFRQHNSLSRMLSTDTDSCGLAPHEGQAVATALSLSPKTTVKEVQEKRSFEQREFREWFDGLNPGIEKNLAAVSQNTDGSKVCTECGCGNSLSITIYFHGIGDFFSAYADSERRAIKKLARDIENSSDPCCMKILLVAKMRFDNIQDTADLIAEQIAEELKKTQAQINAGGSLEDFSSCLRKINFHLVAFSQGGLVAVTVAPKIPCSIYVGPRLCCGIPKSPVIPIKVDIVTIDSPFNFVNLLPGVDTVAECGTWAFEQCLGHLPCIESLTWWCSTAAENYAGDPPSRCICGKTSFYMGYTAAGKDPNLDNWDGWCDIPIDDTTSQGTPMGHNDTVDWVMEKYYDDLIKPRCACNKTSRGCDG